MLFDWHAHDPMQVVADVSPRTARERMTTVQGRPTLGDRGRALFLKVASRLFRQRTQRTTNASVRELRLPAPSTAATTSR